MDGYEQLVKTDIYRARWRRSLDTPGAFQAGRPDSLEYELQDVFHTFRNGHRLMVHVQSSWFPMFDRNPQTCLTDITADRESDFTPATMTVFPSAARPSGIVLRVLP